MTDRDHDGEFERRLTALGIDLPTEEIAHLRRTFMRQRAALRTWEERVPPITEPALVLFLRDDAAPTAGGDAETAVRSSCDAGIAGSGRFGDDV